MKAKSKNLNLRMPLELVELFEEATSRRDLKKGHWMFISAGLVLFFRLPEHKQDTLLRLVAAEAGPGGSFARLIRGEPTTERDLGSI